MAIAAANLVPVERLVTLAAPWRFAAYSGEARDNLGAMWRDTRSTARGLDALPMEVLQAAFWSLDPRRTVAKFAMFGGFDPASAEARRFVQLEDWANEGEPLPYPAARELFEDFFTADLPGQGRLDDRREAGRSTAEACRCFTSRRLTTASLRPPPRPPATRSSSRPAMSG